jgi:hypothetical protein
MVPKFKKTDFAAILPGMYSRLVLWALIVALLLLACFLLARRTALEQKLNVDEGRPALLEGIAKDNAFAAAVEKAATLRVLAAGERAPDGTYCPCPGPYQIVLFETADPPQIIEYGSVLRFRRSQPEVPEVEACDPITIELVLGAETLHSFNAKRVRLTDDSAEKLDDWLRKLNINAKLQAARKAFVAEHQR